MENKLYSINKATILFVFVIFFSLFSSVFATTEELKAAISKNDKATVKTLLDNGDDPNTLGWFAKLPTLEISELLLENRKKPMNPDRFLNEVLSGWYLYNTHVSVEQVKQKDDLVKLALDKLALNPALDKEAFLRHKELDAAIEGNNREAVETLLKRGDDPREIKKFTYFPTPKISKLLLENPENAEKSLDPKRFLYWVLNKECWKLEEPQRKALINLALDKKYGLSLDQIKYPYVVETLHNNQKLVLQNQNIIRDNLRLFWEKFSDLQKNEEGEVDDISKEQSINNAAKIANSRGYCSGLSKLWLYSKWLQFTYPEKSYGYTNDWFKETVRDIAAWDGEKKLDEKQILNFGRFFAIVDFFHQPSIYRKNLSQWKTESIMNLSMLDTDGKILQEELDKKYPLQTLEEFRALLKEKISDDKLVYLIIYFPNGTSHANGLFKHGETYCLYEPNDNNGEYQDTSIEKIAEIIFDQYCFFENKIKAGLVIYDFKKAP